MRSPIVCRKTILVPVVPELESVKFDTDRDEMRTVLGVYGSIPNSDGYSSMPVDVWRLTGKAYWPLSKEEGGAVKRRKVFACNHTGFGDYCHTCKPNTPRDRKAALAGKYGDKVQRKEKESKQRKEVKNNGKEKVKAKSSGKGKGKKKQQVKRKGVRGKTGSQKSNNVD